MRLSNGERIADLEVAVEEYLDPVDAWGGKGGIEEELDAGGGLHGVVHLHGHVFALDDDGAVGGEDTRALRELALAAAPAVDEADAREARRKLAHGEAVEEADEDELAVHLLADVVAEEA